MLDYGYRSRCCKAPIRLGVKKKNNINKSVWVCTKCHKSNIDIISVQDMDNQVGNTSSQRFSEED